MRRLVPLFVLLAAIARLSAGQQTAPSPLARLADLFCNDGRTLCVSRSVERALIAAPFQLSVEVSPSDDVQVGWEIDDSTGQPLVAGSTYDYVDPPFSASSSASRTLHIQEYLLQPAKSAKGTLILSPSRFDSSVGKTDLPKLEIPVRLQTATTKLTILLPQDKSSFDAEVARSVEEDFSAPFKPQTALVPRLVTVMQVANGGRIGAAAQAVLQAVPGQATWHVIDVRVDGGDVHLKLDSGGWAGVTYYSRSVSFLIDKSLRHMRGVTRVIFDRPQPRS